VVVYAAVYDVAVDTKDKEADAPQAAVTLSEAEEEAAEVSLPFYVHENAIRMVVTEDQTEEAE
jgi:hypothetical protein